jgi:hypothetical protein
MEAALMLNVSSFVPQHFHAGVNEALTKRPPEPHSSVMVAQLDATNTGKVQRRASGNRRLCGASASNSRHCGKVSAARGEQPFRKQRRRGMDFQGSIATGKDLILFARPFRSRNIPLYQEDQGIGPSCNPEQYEAER